jgi:hypothetical protein
MRKGKGDYMLWPGIKKPGKELQLKRTNSEVVGMVKNCFVKMYDGSNIKFSLILYSFWFLFHHRIFSNDERMEI